MISNKLQDQTASVETILLQEENYHEWSHSFKNKLGSFGEAGLEILNQRVWKFSSLVEPMKTSMVEDKFLEPDGENKTLE